MSNRTLLIISSGFFLGITCSLCLNVSLSGSLCVLALSGIFFVLESHFSSREFARGSFLFVLFFSLALLRVYVGSESSDTLLQEREGNKVSLEGIVSEEKDVREKSTELTIDVYKSSGKKVKGRVLVVTDLFTNAQYGDVVEIDGVLQKPKNIVAKDGRTFDYVSYLKKEGIEYELVFPKVRKSDSGKGNKIKSFLFTFKQAFITHISKVLPEPHASLLSGLVIGGKQSLPKDLTDTFKAVGVVHIVVLSGYNISVVSSSLMKLVSFLPATLSYAVGSLSIILFALATGGSATVVRASVMALIALLARGTGRKFDMGRALVIAGFLMVLENPYLLLYDPSFQLSFLATLGLIFLTPFMKEKLSLIPEKFGLREIVATTLATQVFVLPFLLYTSGNLSLVALPVNVLILSFVPVTMFFGIAIGIVGGIFPLLAKLLSVPAYVLLSYLLGVVHLFSKIPYASVTVPAFPLWVLVLFYIVLTYFIIKKSAKENIRE